MKRTVKNVMTVDVVTVLASTPFKDVVRLMEVTGASALPVVDEEDRVTGIISESDLLLKEEHRTDEPRRFETRRQRAERSKAEGTLAWHVMTTPVFTAGPDTSIAEAARVMHLNRVKRLPVVDAGGKLAGIVSRRDLLSVFMRPDREIRKEIVHDVIERTLWLTPEEAHVTVSVADGVVKLEGRIDRRSMIQILVGLVYAVEGVIGVENHLSYEIDDTRIQPAATPPWGNVSGLRNR